MSMRHRRNKHRREPLDEATSTQVPGENQHRPRDVAWFVLDYDPGCDCLWNWGDGLESIDGSPREMYWYPKVRPLNRIQDRADYILEFDARRARNKHVSPFTQQLASNQETTIDWTVYVEKVCHTLSQPAADPISEHSNSSEGSLCFNFGSVGVEVPPPSPGTICLLPENEAEVLRLRAFVPRTPIQLGPLEDYRYGFISDFPRIKSHPSEDELKLMITSEIRKRQS